MRKPEKRSVDHRVPKMKSAVPAAVLVLFLLLLAPLRAGTLQDSLLQAIQKYHGISRIDARLELAFSLRKTDHEGSVLQSRAAYAEASKLDDSGRQAKALYYLGLTFYYHDMTDSALQYLRGSADLYRKDRNYEQLPKVLNMLATNNLGSTGDQESSITLYNEALFYARKNNDHAAMAMAYSQLSNIFRMNGAYQQSIEFIYKSKEHYEKAGFIEGVAWINYSVGRIYTTMSLYEEAEKVFLEGLELYRGLPETVSSLTGVAICLDELGLVHLELGDTQKAREYNTKALEIYRKIASDFGMSNALKYRARIEYLEGETDRALSFLDQSLKIKKEMNDILGLSGVYELYGRIFMEKGLFSQAIDSLNTGLRVALNNNQKNRIMLLNKNLGDVYYRCGDLEKAYAYQAQYIALSDSVYQSKATRGMTQLEALYDLEARESKINELEQENVINELRLARESTLRNLLLIILSLIVIFTFFLLKLYASNRRTNLELRENQKKLQELNATKDKFFSIIAHDLKSPFNSIIGFSTLLERYSKQKEYDKIGEFSGHILEVSNQTFKLLENLLEWSRSQTGKIAFSPAPVDIQVPIKNAVDFMYPIAARKQIRFEVEAESCTVSLDQNMMHTVLQNLLSNAIKYSRRDGLVRITAKKTDGTLELSICDEGVGMAPQTLEKLFMLDKNISTPGTDGERGTGLGLILCKEFIAKHGGKITVSSESGKGAVFTLHLPV
ncbi:MAG: tetratricopeptide repeat-containing sensor histidine kinase [Candidatus Marinimicrobia bacterium]|nr:tetratricopeptide repeat-containing sensor histidine kinase [Candidatus Neomarinimicrobiota bacterium]